MDYYEFPKLLMIVALINSLISFGLSMSLVAYYMIFESNTVTPIIKRKKYKYANKMWQRTKNGRLERVLQDSDKIQKLYEKWVKSSVLKVEPRKPKLWYRKAGRLVRN